MAIIERQLTANAVSSVTLEYDDSFVPPRISGVRVVNNSTAGQSVRVWIIRDTDAKLWSPDFPAGSESRLALRPGQAAERIDCPIRGGGKPAPQADIRIDLPES